MNGNTVEELVTKYLAGEATREEAKELLDWVASGKENEEFYLRYKKIFDASAQRDRNRFAIDIDQEWNQFLNKVQKEEETPVVPLSPQRPVWMKLAAALLILAVSGFIISWFISRNSDVVYKTEDETLAVNLPDGSHVTLNDHSTLTYSKKFNQKDRTLTLSGEAFFDVTHNTERPFIINAGKTQVQVVGTSFDVRAYDDENAVNVSVVTGIVKFSKDQDKEVKLSAGQRGIFVKATHKLESTTVTDPNFNSWNTQKLVFVGDDLKSVVETLNKTYHANIIISAEIPPACVVTVSFDHQSLEAVLHVLETTLNLTIKNTSGKIEITHAGC